MKWFNNLKMVQKLVSVFVRYWRGFYMIKRLINGDLDITVLEI